MEKISVIIPTYNRFKYLLNAIDSVVKQSYKNLEIIVINDNSTQKEYYEYDFTKVDSRITIIHLKENSRQKYKIPSPAANARNIGIDNSKGDYIAFLDDDDVWLPNKLEIQIKVMKEKKFEMSATQNFIGNGPYDSSKKYRLGNDELWYNLLKNKFLKQDCNDLDNGLPDIITYQHLLIHNLLITSTIIMTKDLITKTGKFNLKNRNEDHQYWKEALQIISGCYYIKIPLGYYDNSHGDGRLY